MSGRLVCIVMLVADVATFLPAVFGMTMAGFLWDDPHADGLALRFLATLLLLLGPICIVGNVVLLVIGLRRGHGPGVLGWATFLPCCAVLGLAAFLKVQDLQEKHAVRRLERSYAEIVAPLRMAPFRRLTSDLPAWVRYALAERAQLDLAEHGASPPETVDALYAAQYRVMLDHQEAHRRGKMSRPDYEEQIRSDWAQYESIYDKFGETAVYPRAKFLAFPDE